MQHGYDQVAPEYARRIAGELAGKPVDRALLDGFVATFGALGPLCDLGCGPGHVARYLRDRGAASVLGIDLSAGMIDMARAMNPDLPFAEGDMLALDVPDESWGGIVAFYSLIHVDASSLGACCRELARVLRPGGGLLVSFHIGEETLHLEEWWGHEVSLDFHFLLPAAIRRHLEAAGLSVEQVIEREPYAPEIEQQSRRAYVLARKGPRG